MQNMREVISKIREVADKDMPMTSPVSKVGDVFVQILQDDHNKIFEYVSTLIFFCSSLNIFSGGAKPL